MRILGHRGMWSTPEERNTREAFVRCFHAGFGTETDIRDASGALAVSHDIPSGPVPSCAELFELASQPDGTALPLALNIKADGLQKPLRALLDRFGIENYFVFDMSIPEQLAYARAGFRFYTRMSEYEQHPSLVERARGIWLDSFEGLWFDADTIRRHLDAGREVCIVSPELHQRPHEVLWHELAHWGLIGSPGLSLCTDLPVDARNYFHG